MLCSAVVPLTCVIRAASPCALVLIALIHTTCGASARPFATPTIDLNRPRVFPGGPLELNIRFTVYSHVSEDYRVLIHVLDRNEELLWTDDHDPPRPTSSWEPGQTISYQRRTKVPAYPYAGEVTITIGLHAPDTGERLALDGQELGQRLYRVGTLTLEPRAKTSVLTYDAGWYPPEHDQTATWRWTMDRAVIAFRNPRADAMLFLGLAGGPAGLESPQMVSVVLDGRTLHEFVLDGTDLPYRELPLRAVDLGVEENVLLELHVNPPFVPAELDRAAVDTRELGVRVTYVFLEPR